MAEKYLFVSDLDGTLLGADSLISPRSAQIISRLSDQGHNITVATARTPATVDILLQHTRTNPPAIVITGAALWDRHDRRYRNVHHIPADTAAAILGVMTASGLTPFIYIMDNDLLRVFHAGKHLSNHEQRFVDERSALPLKRFYLNSQVPLRYDGQSVLFFAMGSIEATRAAAQRLNGAVDCSLSCYPDTYNPNLGLLEVLASGVSKAAAVRKMKEDLGATHLVVYGDNLNDLPMLAVADTAVAVANALPQVKAAADIVIGPNTADSVALHIASVLADL